MTNTTSMTVEDGARLFVDRIVIDAYQVTVQIMKDILQAGPPGRRPDQLYVSLHNWFTDLNSADQERIYTLIAETARVAVFECLTTLDGMNGGPALPSQASDFGLYLQVYENETAQVENQFQTATRINSPSGTTLYLHEIFMGMVTAGKESSE